MGDTTATTVQSRHSPKGKIGQKYLASGKNVTMRLWIIEQPDEPKPPTSRPQGTVGYVVSGRAELQLKGQTVLLEAGDSWGVPAGSYHTDNILASFTAVEVTYLPANQHGRDEA